MTISGYWCLLIGIILVAISGYWWIFCYVILVVINVIILVVIGDYYINGYR